MHCADTVLMCALISRKCVRHRFHVLKCPEFGWHILCCRMLKRGMEGVKYAVQMCYQIIIVQVRRVVCTYIIVGEDSYDTLKHCKQLR
jgi:hypothetical protein